MSDNADIQLAIATISELAFADQLIKSRLEHALPAGMALSHFSLLNHLAGATQEHSPATLAKKLHLTRAAMTNTLNKLENMGYVHIHPDWEDGRRKQVTLSPAGRKARDMGFHAIQPVLNEVMALLGTKRARLILPALRELRIAFSDKK